VGICLFFNGAHRFFRLLISGRVPFVFDLVVWEIFDQKYTNLEIQPVKRREEIPKKPGILSILVHCRSLSASLPLKRYRIPIGQDRLPTRAMSSFGGVSSYRDFIEERNLETFWWKSLNFQLFFV